MSERFEPSGPLRGSLRPPPDKSISHRAAIIGAMADGVTRVRGYLDSDDTRSTLEAVRALGAEVGEEASEIPGSIDIDVLGIGLRGPAERHPGGDVSIDVGNAGTLLRLLPGWLAGAGSGTWTLDGDESIRKRPVDRVAEPLAAMGGRIECRDDRLPPLHVRGSDLNGIEYRLPIASAQVKSCVLFAGLEAAGETTVFEPAPTRDHSERMLQAAGADIVREDLRTVPYDAGGGPATRVRIRPAEKLSPLQLEVPGDFSSAAFFIVAAILVPGSKVTLEGVGLNPTRVGLLGVLNRMGAPVEVEEGIPLGGEPRGAVTASHGPLTGTRVDPAEVPVTIDELPLVALAAAFADGQTTVTGAAELRHKESDRIAAVVDGINALGGDAEALDDGFSIRGTGGLRGGALDSHGDHRLAMIGAIAGLAARDGVEVENFDAASVSYPGFAADIRSLLGA
jgi:3-phosphoshikimate 1-carboxyvinyltransferase